MPSVHGKSVAQYGFRGSRIVIKGGSAVRVISAERSMVTALQTESLGRCAMGVAGLSVHTDSCARGGDQCDGLVSGLSGHIC